MKIPPFYSIDSHILSLLAKIDANKQYISMYKLPDSLIQKIRRISLLKSAVYSARIEGNPLLPEDFEHSDNALKKKEIENILSAYEYLNKNIKKEEKITKNLIKILHKLIMQDIFSDASFFRKEMSAVYNQAGIAIYVAPPPEKIEPLINELLEYINSKKESFPIIVAIIAHIIFEKIHPFLDGNGRAGRLLMFTILKAKGYDFSVEIPFEQFLDDHKSDYYYHLDNGFKQTNGYIIFMLKAFLEQTENLKKQIELELQKKVILPPRQEEIYNVIKDHQTVSFDFIRRRFLKVPARTLRYDLKKITDQNLIVKIGHTKGSYYRIKE